MHTHLRTSQNLWRNNLIGPKGLLGVHEGREDLGRLLAFTCAARGSSAGRAVKHCGEANKEQGERIRAR